MSQSSFSDSFFTPIAAGEPARGDRLDEPTLLSSPYFLVAGLASILMWWAIAAAI